MSQYDGYNAPSSGEKINPGSVGKVAITNIVNQVLTSAMLCKENPKVSPAGQYVIPNNLLDYRAAMPLFYPGVSDTPSSAYTVYDALTKITRWLLKVGTYSYSEYRICSGVGYDRDSQWSDSGIALFSDSYTASQIGTPSLSPDNGGVLATQVISVSSINNLASNCLNSWRNSSKPNYSNVYEFCHNSCHNSCHSSCHSSCHDDCHNSGHTDTRPWVCHANGTGYNNSAHVHP